MSKRSRARKERELEQQWLDYIKEHRVAYARNWERGNAAKFEEDGHYEWMAKFVDGYETVLEIGTGTGQGTRALLERGHTVISIDENPLCVERATKYLETTGGRVIAESRENITTNEQGYNISYIRPKAIPVEQGALLLEGDIIDDPSLIEWLSVGRSIDAIVCWLIGSHNARELNSLFLTKRVRNPGEYRLCVQNRVYEIADKLLRLGGILHIVDRGEDISQEFLREDVEHAHRDQASVTTLIVESIEQRLYEEPNQPKSIPMTTTIGLSGRVPEIVKPALVSIISRKPA